MSFAFHERVKFLKRRNFWTWRKKKNDLSQCKLCNLEQPEEINAFLIHEDDGKDDGKGRVLTLSVNRRHFELWDLNFSQQKLACSDHAFVKEIKTVKLGFVVYEENTQCLFVIEIRL
jgi:hypothetical protein